MRGTKAKKIRNIVYGKKFSHRDRGELSGGKARRRQYQKLKINF